MTQVFLSNRTSNFSEKYFIFDRALLNYQNPNKKYRVNITHAKLFDESKNNKLCKIIMGQPYLNFESFILDKNCEFNRIRFCKVEPGNSLTANQINVNIYTGEGSESEAFIGDWEMDITIEEIDL